MPDPSAYATHAVTNQPPPLEGHDAFATDPALARIVAAFGGGWAAERLHETGVAVATTEIRRLARAADRNPPVLVSHDRFGHRIDEIEFHPAWHDLMRRAMADGVHSLAWEAGRPGAHVARGAVAYLWAQAEAGILCPLTMTHAAIPVVRRDPALRAAWERLLLSPDYDGRPLPAAGKHGATCAMAMTEKQGGSDLRQIATEAEPAGDGLWALKGHKWFFSAPQSDLFLALARTSQGVTCFALPGWLPDGTRNRLLLQRLKDKCGNRSNASSEVEFRGALGTMLGEEGRGVAAILEMGHLTRIDCALASAAQMRLAVAEAAWHAAHRSAFQRRLIDQPLMQAVLADLALEAEAAAWLAFRAAATLDADPGAAGEAERLLGRLVTPIAKFWICKRAPALVAEALECHGGNGFVEDHLMARLYREAPLNGVWEGSGNVICLDMLRAAGRATESVGLLLDELRAATGFLPAYDRALAALEPALADLFTRETAARLLAERLALLLSAALLLRHGDPAVAEAFVAARLGRDWSGAFGTLPDGVDAAALARRAVPAERS